MKNNKRRIGIIEGKFYPCSKSPKCVSTQDTDKSHKMEPMKYETTLQEAKLKIIKIVKLLKRSKIITDSENYLHIEFRTTFWRFVDDVEFYFDDAEKNIHFRSSARFGYYDWGVNRKRMENIVDSFINA